MLLDTLKAAAQRGYLEDIKNQITAENLNDSDDLGNTLLHIAAGSGQKSIVEFILSKKEIKNSINKKK